jgi:hypothetical protein
MLTWCLCVAALLSDLAAAVLPVDEDEQEHEQEGAC